MNSDIAPSLGMGTVYVSAALLSLHLDAYHEVADEHLLLRYRPVLREVPEVRNRAIPSVSGNSTLLCSSWVSASSLTASNCS